MEKNLLWGRTGDKQQLSMGLRMPSLSSVECNNVTAYKLRKNMLAADTPRNILIFIIGTCKMNGELVQMIIL